jgi:hypothetical protein
LSYIYWQQARLGSSPEARVDATRRRRPFHLDWNLGGDVLEFVWMFVVGGLLVVAVWHDMR